MPLTIRGLTYESSMAHVGQATLVAQGPCATDDWSPDSRVVGDLVNGTWHALCACALAPMPVTTCHWLHESSQGLVES